MWDRIELSQHIKVGRRPPDEREIDGLRKEAVRAVVDLRTHDETFGKAMTPAAEARQVRARGMDYIHVPVSSESVDKTDLDRVGEALKHAPKPVLIHDSSGNRAGMIALAHTAIEAGVPGMEMLEMARHLDLVFGDPPQQEVFAHYVDQRRTRPDPFARRQEGRREDGRAMPLLAEDTGTLAAEIQEDHHREFAQDEARVVTPAPTPMETHPIATEPPRPPAPATAR
ncbi:MAG TPA: sulfur transferase domain-containing protein, partial [Acetobacteraceae bacterium]|nr:sulfur transferase domain-containing protein [Acetobacteraceae bacterium]